MLLLNYFITRHGIPPRKFSYAMANLLFTPGPISTVSLEACLLVVGQNSVLDARTELDELRRTNVMGCRLPITGSIHQTAS